MGKDLERASAQAISRIQELQGQDLIFPRLGLLGGYDGGPQSGTANEICTPEGLKQ